MKACTVLAVMVIGGHALVITPIVAVLLIVGGVLLAALAFAAIVGIVYLAGGRPPVHLLGHAMRRPGIADQSPPEG